MFFGNRQDEAQRLHDQALAFLDRGELDEARRIAGELRGMQWSGAFEILALAARAEGDLEGAARALDEGVALAPAAWTLRQLLGTIHDERGRHDDALRAYDGALRCEGAWKSSIRFNRAVSRMLAGDPGAALADAESVLEDPATPPFTLDALRVGIDALDALGRREDAVSLVRAMSSSVAEDDARGRAEMDAFAALVGARAGTEIEAVRASIAASIEGGASRREILDAITVLSAGAPEASSRFRVAISAPAWTGAPPGVVGYLRVLEIRADDAARASELARTLEPSAVQDAITIEQCQLVGSDRGPTGVVAASARISFGDE